MARSPIFALALVLAAVGCDGGELAATDESGEAKTLAKKTKPGKGSCADDNGGCDANATCTQTKPNRVSCACKTGFTGDGLSCTAALAVKDFLVSVGPVLDPSVGFTATLTWTSVSETGVTGFVAQTSIAGGAFRDRASVTPTGAGASYSTTFGLLQEGGETVIFRLVAVLGDGSRATLGQSEPLAIPRNPPAGEFRQKCTYPVSSGISPTVFCAGYADLCGFRGTGHYTSTNDCLATFQGGSSDVDACKAGHLCGVITMPAAKASLCASAGHGQCAN